MNHASHPLSSADISIFSSEISKYCYIRTYRYRLHFDTQFLILLTFFESLRSVFSKHGYNLMISAKLATPGLFKTKIFGGKGYDIIIPDYDVQTKFYHVTQIKLNYFYIIM